MLRRTAVAILLTALCGWNMAQAQTGRFMSQYYSTQGSNPDIQGAHEGAYYLPTAANYIGPGGAPVSIQAPSASQSPSIGQDMAFRTVASQLPPEILQQVLSDQGKAMPLPGMAQTPPIQQINAPGFPVNGGPNGPPIAGAVAAIGALTGPPPSPFPALRTSVRFSSPNDMRISWYAPQADGRPGFGAQYLTVPGSYNFPQAAIYRLKLENLPNRNKIVALYPTLEVVPCNARTATFLAHSSVPVSFTEEDLDQVSQGNFLVKVIYLPDPQFQEVGVGTEEIISTRLEPGVDPIAEAHRRGNILLIVRLGNIDLELPHSPPLTAPGTYQPQPRPGAIPQMQGGPGAPGGLPQMILPPMPPALGPAVGPQGGPVTMQSTPAGGAQQMGYLPAPNRVANTPAAGTQPGR